MKEPFVEEAGKALVATVISATLDEHTIRLNRPASASHGLLFYRLMEQAVCVFRRDLGADSGGTWAVIPE